ncbi:hypothetical protein GGI20_004449 [Coemansia sp. BCRC 34301]|nr:hypothetical protein GGI20_004449 [Coemansia sp. BCRC 34301]
MRLGTYMVFDNVEDYPIDEIKPEDAEDMQFMFAERSLGVWYINGKSLDIPEPQEELGTGQAEY